MNSKRNLVAIGILSAVVLSALPALAISPKLVFNQLQGSLHVVQDLPCNAMADLTTTIADGRMEITPVAVSRREAAGGVARFDLTRLELFFTPFSARHECLGLRASIDYREVGVRLATGVTFTAEAIGRPEERHYRFSIPKEEILIFASVVDNMPVPQPQTAYQRPSEDVTGEIDLLQQTAHMRIALSTERRVRIGCVGKRCVIDDTLKGTQTADIVGVVVNPRSRITKTKR